MIGAFSLSKVQSYFLSLSRANRVQLPSCDLDPPAEMSPSVDWNGLLIGAVLA